MLVLSRQRDESIIIGDNIVVTIVDVRGDKVRLGIEAPREVSVHRREVYEAIQRENREASKIQLDDARQIGRALESSDFAWLSRMIRRARALRLRRGARRAAAGRPRHRETCRPPRRQPPLE